jgi:site-specific recombinase XerD
VFSSTEGPGTGDAPVSAVAARSALQRAVRDSALATRRIGTRSLRVGTATEMAAAGVPLADIMAVTGHRSVSEAVRYIRLLSPRFQPHLDV